MAAQTLFSTLKLYPDVTLNLSFTLASPPTLSVALTSALRRNRWATRDNGSPNFEMDERTFLLNRERAVDYLNMLDRLYVFDGYAGWDPAVSPIPCPVVLRAT